MKENRGQSLLEVIIALAVVMLVILALVRVVISSVKSSDFAKKGAQAASYAQEGMEKVRAYLDQNSWQTFSDNCQNLILLGLQPTPAPSFGLAVDCIDDGSKKRVTVTVSWEDSTGTHKSEQISYFTNQLEWK